MRLIIIKCIPNDIRWIIETWVRLAGESSDSFISYMSSLGRSTCANKRKAKRLDVSYKCARMTCNTRCHSLEMVSDNREDKIKLIRDGLSNESLDDILMTLEMRPIGYVHHVIHMLHEQLQKERQHLSLGNLNLKDLVCQFIRKLDWKLVHHT